MAVYFRHGSNGAYKSAYAVWFEILPALRNGRLVVTNIEGMKSMSSIEEILGEKFPPGAQLVRIFSRGKNGVHLWQNWFSWMPVGALVVIDECQDIFTADVGFKREKAQQQPFETFVDMLPDNFSELFYSRWTKVDLDTLEDGDLDDTGETQVDEQGRLLYPYNFYGAFMRHRKYQWDIIMLTPDWTSIPTWLRGCAQDAYSHRSTDTFFRKRKPRIFNHRPNSTKTAPTTKADFASCSSKKIPVDVFALYKSTGTGDFNESKSDISMLKSPKFLGVMLIGVLAMGNAVREVLNVSSDNSEDTTSEVVNQDEANGADGVSVPSGVSGSVTQTVETVSQLDNGSNSNQDNTSTGVDAVNPFSAAFPVFDNAQHVYVTSVSKVVDHFGYFYDFHFRIDKSEGSYYVSSEVLKRYGYQFERLDDCNVMVTGKNASHLLTCPPYETIAQAKTANLPDKQSQLANVDIFSLSN